MTLKCKDLLFFPLGDLKLTINHLCACLLIRQGTLRIGVITEKTSKKTSYLAPFKTYETRMSPCY